MKPQAFFGMSVGERKAERFGAARTLRGLRSSVSMGRGSSEQRTIGREVSSRLAEPSPGAVPSAFGRAGRDGEQRYPSGNLCSWRGSSPAREKGRDERARTDRRVGFSQAILRKGDMAPRLSDRSLTGTDPSARRLEARPHSRCRELRLRRRQECPARTHSVGFRLRS